jgi:hypothetical protein
MLLGATAFQASLDLPNPQGVCAFGYSISSILGHTDFNENEVKSWDPPSSMGMTE